MNLSTLFEMQRQLDERIVKEHGLEGQDLLPKKILALQVELGECANEWRGFKFWSKDQEPRYEKKSVAFADPGGPFEYTTQPLLEEYIDCLHFILSIGLELEPEMSDINQLQSIVNREESGEVNAVYVFTGLLQQRWVDVREYGYGFRRFITLGRLLGFTWDQIESAYKAKWEINQQRQSNGY